MQFLLPILVFIALLLMKGVARGSHRQPLNESSVTALGADQTVTSTTYVDVLDRTITVNKTQMVKLWASCGRISGNATSPNRLHLQLWDDTASAEIMSFQIDGTTTYVEKSSKLVWAISVTGGVSKTVKLRAKVETSGDSFILRATTTALGYAASED